MQLFDMRADPLELRDLADDDRLVLYTDGVTEAMGPAPTPVPSGEAASQTSSKLSVPLDEDEDEDEDEEDEDDDLVGSLREVVAQAGEESIGVDRLRIEFGLAVPDETVEARGPR